jgi:hypothetical protein
MVKATPIGVARAADILRLRRWIAEEEIEWPSGAFRNEQPPKTRPGRLRLARETLERWGMPHSGSLQPGGRKLPHHHFARPL